MGTAEIDVPKIDIIKSFWNRERAVWMGMRAAHNVLASNDAYKRLDELMDTALDLGLVPLIASEP